MQPRSSFYVTTPIYYVNGVPHIGHIYTTTLAECAKLYHQYKGEEAFMLTGCDEHGLKVQTTAEQNNVSPQQWCDKVAGTFKECFKIFNLTGYDRFIRTTDQDHVAAAQHLWTLLADRGYIYKAKYEGWYNVSDECFVTEQNLKDGTDKDGNPCKVTVDGDVPCTFSSEENYMFRLTEFREELLKYYEDNPDAIYPQFRLQEVVHFIKTGLQDLSISRPKSKIYWGIPVPGDEEHTMYVWIDALANYLTGAGWPNQQNRWPASFHVLGKDIIRFHCVYWPAFLKGAGLPYPRRFFVHGWWVAPDSKKIGKSLGNASPPQVMAQKFGVDALRYYMLSEATGEGDAVITDDLVAAKLNADLCNSLGNLLNRCIIERILPDQKVPQNTKIDALIRGECVSKFHEQIDQLIKQVNGLYATVDKFMVNLKTKDSLLAIFSHIYQLNNFLQSTGPWKLLKEDRDEYDVVMYTAIECLRIVGILLLPFLTEKAPVMLRQLGIERDKWEISERNLQFGVLRQGSPVGKGEKQILFNRFEEKTAMQKQAAIDMARKNAPKDEFPAAIQCFSKCDLRVTQVKTCTPVEDSNKLLLMKLDCGADLGEKTFVAGIAAHYKPEEMVGRKIITIVNLKPRKMCGGKIISEAMLFAGNAGSGPDTPLKLCSPDSGCSVGTRVVIEGYEELPDAAGDPKKNFDKILKELKAKDGVMALESGYYLVAGGKRISCDVPDGTPLG